MTKYAKILLSLIIIILLVAGFFFLGKDKKEEVKEPTVTDAPIEGCYVANLGKDVYALKVDSEDKGVFSGMLSYNNFEKDSSSGAFTGTYMNEILLGNYSFDSEGMRSNSQVIFKKAGDTFVQGFGDVKTEGDRQVFVDVSKVTFDPKSTFVKSENCTEEFVGAPETVSFEHNAFFVARTGDGVPTLEWRNDAKQKGMIMARVSVPKGYLPNTNFSNAFLNLARASDANEIKNCTVASTNEKNAGTATFDGFSFTKFTSNDAGAGNFYETTSYRGIVDGDCYVAEYTIHSTNIQNYPTEQGIKEFAKSKVQDELEKIIKSVDFLVNSD